MSLDFTENWQKEFAKWCPDLKLLNYYGSQDERRHMRLQIVQEAVEYDVILTTYNMVVSSADDRVLFRKLDFHYVIFDEAHMLKNMATARYETLMRVQASRKLLLTGTPLQNNLVELMSLLVFVMPDMFANKKEQLRKMFSMFPVRNVVDFIFRPVLILSYFSEREKRRPGQNMKRNELSTPSES